MKIVVCIEEREFAVSCGDGTQPVRWLGSVATARYEPIACVDVGSVVSIVLERTKSELNPNDLIQDCLEDNDRVRVVTESDYVN